MREEIPGLGVGGILLLKTPLVLAAVILVSALYLSSDRTGVSLVPGMAPLGILFIALSVPGFAMTGWLASRRATPGLVTVWMLTSPLTTLIAGLAAVFSGVLPTQLFPELLTGTVLILVVARFVLSWFVRRRYRTES
jgi:hypothetical protein